MAKKKIEIRYLYKKVAEFTDLKANMQYQDTTEKMANHIRFIAKTFETSKEYRQIMEGKCKLNQILIK